MTQKWARAVLITAVLAIQIPATLVELPRLGWYRYSRELSKGIRGAYR